MLDAYRGARAFLRATPGMPMFDLPNAIAIGPVAQARAPDRAEVARRLRLPEDRRSRRPGCRSGRRRGSSRR